VIHGDTVLAVVAARYTADSDADDPVVVTTPNASARIDERVRAAGGRVERVRLGSLHEGIARERSRGGEDTELVFAAEPWKHPSTAFGGWIDGVVSAAVVAALVADAGDTDRLRDPVTERPYRKVSIECPDAAKADVMTALETELPRRFRRRRSTRTTASASSSRTRRGCSFDRAERSRTSASYAESDSVDALVDDARSVIETAVEKRR